MTALSAYVLSPLREGLLTLYRGLGDGLSPILLAAPAGDYLSTDALQRLEHEYALRSDLDGDWAARPIELAWREGRPTLVLADPGGEPLERLLGRPLGVTAFLRIAIPLAAAGGRLHARGLIHKDLNPANILVDTTSGGVWLTGFGIASRLLREHQVPAPPEVIAGTLAYMAPEQTGRMNRSVDSRSDLYALGVTFYEMLTGVLPFTAADPMEWVHCHIARQPVPPDKRSAGIPGPLSAIVMKLLAKTAEDRYQTAAGLAVDLRRCLAEWQSTGGIAPFPLGRQDASDRLLIPERLYGREPEIDRLLAAFERVVARGTPELVLVSGYSGIGKSSVVNELHKALVPARGLFASGKFDQYKRDIPYATLAQAFGSLVRPLLGESEATLGRWRDALSEALGQNGQLIVNLVPELDLVIGKQPAVADLPPQDAQNRFQMVFRRFLGVFARQEHPLALFLDDLQWLDAATLDLLEHLIMHPEVRHLLLIGAYRHNEVGPTHPLLRTLEAIREAGAKVHKIELAPLALDDIGRLVADTLHCKLARARPLAHLVQEKTAGNPFFAIQFIAALAEEGLLAFDSDAACWTWDLVRIHAKSFTDNVVDLMVGKLSRLSAATQQALRQLACLGNSAPIATLSTVHGASEAGIHAALWEAARAGLVLRLPDAYAFLHDRVQEAAYALIPEGERAAVHLRIGRMLLAEAPSGELEDKIFDIMNQLNRGADLITSQGEKVRFAELNMIAGRKAKASAAYKTALNCFSSGIRMLGDDPWENWHDLAYRLRFERAETEYLSRNFDGALYQFDALLAHARTPLEKADIHRVVVDLHTTRVAVDDAIARGQEALRLFGIDIPSHPSHEQVTAEYEAIWQNLGQRPIEELIDLPLMTDPEIEQAMHILAVLFAPSIATDRNLLLLCGCHMVNMSIRHGNCDASVMAYGYLGMNLGPFFGDYRQGFRFGMLGYDLMEKRKLVAYKAKIEFIIGCFISFWLQPLNRGIEHLGSAFKTAADAGDLNVAGYCCDCLVSHKLVAGEPLDTVYSQSESLLTFTRETKFDSPSQIIIRTRQFIQAMQGRTVNLSSFSGPQFDEDEYEQYMDRYGWVAVNCGYYILKLQARVVSGDYQAAIAARARAEPILWSIVGMIHEAEYYFYGALACAAHYDDASVDERTRLLTALEVHHKKLEIWAANCRENFESRATLIGAEIARIQGRVLDAECLYEQAIRSARANGFVHNAALAYEFAGRFYAARGFEQIAHLQLRNARHAYFRWGALGKVRQLDERHPHLQEEWAATAAITATDTQVEQLDVFTIVKASQAMSGEIVLDRLIETLMTIALEYAGAERGLLILLRGESLQIEAEARTNHQTIGVTLRQQPPTLAELPEALLHTVIRTRQSVILDDASAQNLFSADAYIRQTRARSVLCLPLVKQAKLIGVLYLENNLASHVFTPARISVLELLASQAAISLENAGLYAELQVSEDRWRNLFENVPVGVTLTGLDGRYVAANRTFQNMTGYSEAELRDLSPVDITHEDDRAAVAATLAARAAGLPYRQHHEKRYRRKDGSVIWVDASAFVAPGAAGAPLFAAVVLDITDRKRAEQELRRSEASLAQAQQISHTGSWRFKVSNRELSWSAEYFRIFGFDPATTRPCYATLMERIHPEDRPSVEEGVERAARDRSRFQHEYRIVLPDGSVKHVRSAGQPDISDSGDLEFVGTVMDITERKHAEEELRNAQSELARVTRLTTMGELVASIAHEINQPLAGVVTNGNAGLNWLNRNKPDLDEARSALSRIVRDGTRAGEVIRGLRALAKKSGPRLTEFDIDEAIHEVIALTRSEVQRHGVIIQIDLSAHGRPVLGDRVQLQQVLLNLIMNGIEAMRSITDRMRQLTVSSTLKEPANVLIAVEDTGLGLDPAIAQRVFEPFFTTKTDGLGMGLSVCRTIIEAHGGHLWTSPRAPHGTAFHFTVPVAVAA